MEKNKILNMLNELMEEHNVPAVQVGIVKDGEIIFNEALGYRDYENKIKADTETMFAIGSASKAFGAEAIAILVDEGKIEWDKAVQHYIPEFRMYDSYVSENLTVRDMLCHRCGLPRHDLMWILNDGEFTMEDIVHKLRYLKPNEPFRYKMQYQNHMFSLAGYLIERVTGQKWGDFVHERILMPLGMEHTNSSIEDLKKAENKALGYDYDEKKEVIKQSPYRNIDEVGVAGSVNSNIEDMLKWVKFNLAKGKWNGETIISEESIKECHSPQMIVSEPVAFDRDFEGIDFFSYGFGWFMESYKGHKVIHHGGNIDGFTALVTFVPGMDLGFVILTNKNSTLTYVVQNTLLDSFFEKEETDWNSKYNDSKKKALSEQKKAMDEMFNSAPKNTKPSLELDSYNGEYENEAYGKITISTEDDKLIFELGSNNVKLEHLCFDTFLMEFEIAPIRLPLQFRIGTIGKVTGLGAGLEPSIEEMIEFVKVEISDEQDEKK